MMERGGVKLTSEEKEKEKARLFSRLIEHCVLGTIYDILDKKVGFTSTPTGPHRLPIPMVGGIPDSLSGCGYGSALD